MRTRRTLAFVGVLAAAAGALSATTAVLPVSAKDSLIVRAARGELRPARIPITISPTGSKTSASVQTYRTMPFFSGGVLDAATNALQARDARDTAGDTGAPAGAAGNVTPAQISGNGNEAGDRSGTLGISLGTLGCSKRLGGSEGDNGDASGRKNVRVNQDCTYRRQAEEMIAYNPANPNNLLAGQNDSRVGFNQCGIDWSIDNGKHWGDLLPPFRQKLNNPAAEEPVPGGDPNRHTILGGDGTFHTYDAGSDPALAFDSRGNSYFSCVGFDIASNASLLYVTQSPASAQGSFFYNLSSFSRRFVVAEDNSPFVFHDKNMVVADKNPNSPNRDNVYVTWTVFKFGANCLGGTSDNPSFCESPIFGSMSTDGARHWSTPEEISGTSDALCAFGNFFDPTQPPGACNNDQGSNPAALPNGDLEVIFNNGNTLPGNPNAQQLGVHCHPSGNSATGTAHLNCATPSFVGRDVTVGEPQCDFGRAPEECIPGPNIRTNDFPVISKNAQNNHLYATWQDYRNGEYDIQLSQSTDGGLTWHDAGTVNPDRGLDHYFPAIEQSPASSREGGDKSATTNGDENGNGGGDRVGNSYYRSERVPGENSPATAFAFTPCPSPDNLPCNASFHPQGKSDYVLAGGTGTQTPYNFKVLSPAFAPPDGAQAGFNGDYSGLTINRGIEAHPVWSDTRNTNPYPLNGVVHDEDVFTDNVALPSGRGELQTGQIGSEHGRSGGDQSGG